MSQLSEKTDEEFVEYLRMVAADFEASGNEATAEDYEEAARRIELSQDLVKREVH